MIRGNIALTFAAILPFAFCEGVEARESPGKGLVAQLRQGEGLALPGGAAPHVTYEQYGAKGDGMADDMPAIVAAHEAANAKGLPVHANDAATYYIHGDGLTARIGTDTDFGTAKFVIDDRGITNTWSFVFAIEPGKADYAVTNVVSLKRGMARIGATFPGRTLVKFEDGGRRQYRRTGNADMTNNGAPQCELLIVGPDGALDPSTAVVQDMKRVTRARAFPIDERPLTVSGGRFTTIANRETVAKGRKWSGYHRGFGVTRSNVHVKGIVHEVVDEMDCISPYYGFLRILRAADVTVSDCVFQAHRKTLHGTYDFDVNNSVNVSVVRCRESTCLWEGGKKYWWAFSSDYCRNILFDGCEFGRFDAHCGVHNTTIRDSHLAVLAVTGGGLLLVENTVVEGSYRFISLRFDYGSTWDGDIVVRNCVFRPEKGMGGIFACADNDGSHDYGYPCHMGRRIVVDGLKVENGEPGPDAKPFTWFYTGTKAYDPNAPYAYHFPEEVTVRNVSVSNGAKPRPWNNEAFFGGIRINGGR